MSAAAPTELLERAQALARFHWAVRVGTGVLAMGLAVAAGLAGALGLAALSAPVSLRFVALGLALLALLWAATRAVREALRLPPPPRAAALVERRFPELQDRFVTAVEIAWEERLGADGRAPQLTGPAASTATTCSPALARALLLQTQEAVRNLNLREAVDSRPVRRLGLAAAAAATLLLASALAFPKTWANMLAPPTERGGAALTPAMREAGPQPSLAGPSLLEVALRLEYPAYTGLAAETRDSGLEAVSAIAGTRVTVSARVAGDHPTAEAVLNGTAQSMEIGAQQRAATVFVLRRDLTWQLRATDRVGRAMTTAVFRLAALADRPPRVALAEPGKSVALKTPAPVRLAYEASDDWGLIGVALEYRGPAETKWQTVSLSPGGGRAVSGAFDWDLAPLRLVTGQSVAYRVTARDNDTVTGPKSASTPIYLVTIGDATVVAPTQAAQEAATREAEGLEQLQEEAQKLGRQLDEALGRLEKGEMTREEQARRAAELAEAQRRIAEQADKVSQALQQSEKQVAAEGVVPPEVRDKLAELHDLLQKTMNEDMKRALEQLQQALKSANPQELQQGLQQARQSQQDFASRLDQAIQLLKRARLEQDVARAAEQAERLAGEQRGLNENRPKPQAAQPETARRQAGEQRQLKDRAAGLEGDLRRMAQEAQPLDPTAAEKVGKTAEGLQRAGTQQAMQQAADRLQQGDPAGAQPPQEQALEDLSQAAASLRQLQSSMSGSGAQTLSRAAREMTRDALFLSKQQEQLMPSTRDVDALSAQTASRGKAQRERLRRNEEALAQSTRDLGERMRKLSQQTPLMDPALAQKAGQTADTMAQAAREAAAGAGPQAAETQREAMGELNSLAEDLLRLGDNMQQAAQGMGMQQLMQELQGLSQQQQGLNQKTEQQARQGSTPRPDGSRGNLAEQQQQIREALERLMQKAGKPSGLPDRLGDVPGKMQDVERNLQQEQAGSDTVQRQQDILRRMLDAQRSVYQKNQERRERVSERPKPYRLPSSPPELQPRSAPQTGPRMTPSQDSDLPLDYEDLVREYFRALSERP